MANYKDDITIYNIDLPADIFDINITFDTIMKYSYNSNIKHKDSLNIEEIISILENIEHVYDAYVTEGAQHMMYVHIYNPNTINDVVLSFDCVEFRCVDDVVYILELIGKIYNYITSVSTIYVKNVSSYDSKTRQIYLNIDQNLDDVIIDYIHEFMHYIFDKHFNMSHLDNELYTNKITLMLPTILAEIEHIKSLL